MINRVIWLNNIEQRTFIEDEFLEGSLKLIKDWYKGRISDDVELYFFYIDDGEGYVKELIDDVYSVEDVAWDDMEDVLSLLEEDGESLVFFKYGCKDGLFEIIEENNLGDKVEIICYSTVSVIDVGTWSRDVDRVRYPYMANDIIALNRDSIYESLCLINEYFKYDHN